LKKKSRLIIIVGTCALLLAITVIIIDGFGEKMISGNENDIEKITFILNSTQEQRTKEVIDRQSIMQVFNIIQKTYDITTNRHPSHNDSMQADSKLDIVILYKSGNTEVIHTCEIPTRFYRFLDTKGGSGDLGYIIGTNDSIWGFVEDKVT